MDNSLNEKYGTWDFDDLLKEISVETNRLKCEMNIYNFNYNENISTYNKLTTTLLLLQEIKTR